MILFSKKRGSTYSVFYAMPAVLVFVIFLVLPALAGFYYAFTDWTTASKEIKFIGLEQFKRLFELNYFGTAVINTIMFTITTTVFKLLFGMLLALAVNRQLRTRNTLRGLAFSPTLINNIVLGIVFMAILAPNGLFNDMLKAAGLGFIARGWLQQASTAIHCVSFLEIWKWSGQMMVIFLAGLQSVPAEYYEAAEIDGANSFKKFWNVTFPLIRPAFNINLLLCVIFGIRVFDIVFALTHGGPGTASEVLNTIVFQSLGNGFYGFGSAANLIVVIAALIVAIPLLRYLTEKEVNL